jgi:hypothetical protein
MSIGELNARAGRKKKQNHFYPATKEQHLEGEVSLLQMEKGDNKYEHYSRQEVSDMPHEFTWEENIGDAVQ